MRRCLWRASLAPQATPRNRLDRRKHLFTSRAALFAHCVPHPCRCRTGLDATTLSRNKNKKFSTRKINFALPSMNWSRPDHVRKACPFNSTPPQSPANSAVQHTSSPQLNTASSSASVSCVSGSRYFLGVDGPPLSPLTTAVRPTFAALT